MFTRIQPAGNLFRYLTSAVDSMGEEREVTAKRIRGSLTSVVRMLQAQAPVGVSRRSKRKPGPRRARPPSDWIRHCQEHLVHLINCYIEPDALIQEHLPRIVRGTEDLLLAGLPRAALAFVWYEHQQEFGTHPHGGLLRLVLPGGQPYVPNLNPQLLLQFDRLVSRRFGFVDPLDPRGHRLFYAAWASSKLCNAAEIKVACEAVQQAWEQSPGDEFTHDRVRQICEDNDLPILVAPDAAGQAQRQKARAFPHLRVPLRRQTVVVASFDRRRAICFAGPACHHDFDPKLYADRLKHLENMVVQLQRDPAPVYVRFERLLGDRIEQQQQQWGEREAPVNLDAFAMLREPSHAEQERAALELEIKVATAIRDYERAEELQHQLNESRPSRAAAMANGLAMMNPLVRWSERAYPFATEQDLLRAGALHDPQLRVLLHPATAAADPFRDSLEAEVIEADLADFQELQRQQQQRGLALRISRASNQRLLAEQHRHRQQVQCELAIQICRAAGVQFEQFRRRQLQQQRGLAIRISLAASQRQWAGPERERQRVQRELALQICRTAGVQFEQFRRRQLQQQRGLAMRISLAASQRQLAGPERERLRMQRELVSQICRTAGVQFEQFHRQQLQQQRGLAVRVSLAASQLHWAEAQRQRRQQRQLTLDICGSASWQHEAFRVAARERRERIWNRRFERTEEEIWRHHVTERPALALAPLLSQPALPQKPEPQVQPPPARGPKPESMLKLTRRADYDELIRALATQPSPEKYRRQIELYQRERDQKFPLPSAPKPAEPPRQIPPAIPPDAPGPLNQPPNIK